MHIIFQCLFNSAKVLFICIFYWKYFSSLMARLFFWNEIKIPRLEIIFIVIKMITQLLLRYSIRYLKLQTFKFHHILLSISASNKLHKYLNYYYLRATDHKNL